MPLVNFVFIYVYGSCLHQWRQAQKKLKLKMLTIFPPLFGYPLEEDLRGQELKNMVYYNGETETSDSLLNSPTFQRQVPQDEFKQFSLISNDEPRIAKKINHNASERDRRKKVNTLYSSLRSLLPPSYQEKKLSIPATVSRVLKYIPELLKEMEALTKKKEGLVRRISEQENSTAPLKKQRKCPTQSSSSSSSSMVSATRIGDRELMIQITTMKFSSCIYAEVLSRLEQNSLVLLNSSCFQSFQGRALYNLHLEVCGAQVMELEGLKKELLSIYEKQEEPVLLSNLKSFGQIGETFVNN